MTYAEAIDGPIGRTTGSPLGERVCWQITSAPYTAPGDEQRDAHRSILVFVVA